MEFTPELPVPLDNYCAWLTLYNFGQMRNPSLYKAVFASFFCIPDKITFNIFKDMTHK